MKKRILLDGLSLINRPKGVQIYVLNLLKEYIKFNKEYEFTVIIRKGLNNLPDSGNINYEVVADRYTFLWKFLKLPNYVNKKKFDLVHLIGDNPTLGNITVPYVVTILESAETYYRISAKNKWKGLKPFIARNLILFLHGKMIKTAAVLIAISNKTAAYLKSNHNVSESKIKTIYFAASDIFFREAREKLPELIGKEPYILVFDTGDFRENVFTALKAFSLLKNEIPHNLVVCGLGTDKDMKTAEDNCKNLDILDRVVFLGYMPQEKLVSVYKNADIYIDMTLFEGFGLQICEAMASGLPVIASNVYSIPELVEDAGIMLDPYDIEGLVSAIKRIVKNPAEKSRLKEASFKQAKNFSWEKTAVETLKVYDEVLCQKSQF